MTTTPAPSGAADDPDDLAATSGPGSQPVDLDDDPAALRREAVRRRHRVRELEVERDDLAADRDRGPQLVLRTLVTHRSQHTLANVTQQSKAQMRASLTRHPRSPVRPETFRSNV